MGLGGIVKSVVNKAAEVVKPVVDTITKPASAAAKIAPTVSQFNSVTQNLTGKLLGNDPISDITRNVVDRAQNLVAPAAEAVTRNVLNEVGNVSRGFLGRVGDFFSNVGNRIVDAGRTVVNSTIEGIVGFGRSVVEGVGQTLTGIAQTLNPAPLAKVFQGDFSGAWNDFRNNITNGAQNIGGGLVKATIQAPFDTFIVGLNGTISSLQTLTGLEPPSRGLTDAETAQLRSIYGDSVDYSQIRIKQGNLGIAQGLAPHTIGNTIYIPEGWNSDPSELLAHETAHVWQYQNGGTDYIGESLWNQAKGFLSGGDRNAAYEFEQPIRDGKSWAELNPEQQAALIEEAYRDGLFRDPNARLEYNGTDYTDYARAAIAEMRAGRGAP